MFWIKYVDEGGYLFFPYCPLDYCKPSTSTVYIKLNSSGADGPDQQCDNNRTGILCGKCPSEFGLSLGSSKCMKCHGNEYGVPIGIIAVALVAGILLVIIILVLNLTVAIGTLNSIVFYANIVYANRGIYFKGSPTASTIISWLNLDIGIDTCFYQTMDTYWKTWIQLLFPAYIIGLVVLIIKISSCSSKFSNIIGKRDPVATLATLLLLSYTRLLVTVIRSFEFVTVEYSNNTTKTLWLPDASIAFGNNVINNVKLIVLITFAVIVSLICLFCTFLFSWQWLLRFPNLRFFRLTRNLKFHAFIDTFQISHTTKHRYWTGLLLLVRVLIFTITALVAHSELPITLFSTVIIMSCLQLYKTLLMIRVYKNWFLNIMESITTFNIAIFALITLLAFNVSGYTNSESEAKMLGIAQKIAAHVSVLIMLLFLTIVIIYHCYQYFRCASCSQLCRKLKMTATSNSRLAHVIEENETILEASNSDYILDVIDNPRAKYATPFVPFKAGKQTSQDVLSKVTVEPGQQ